MPRKQRIWYPNRFYHIVMRGNNRQTIFSNQEDVREFFRVLQYVYDKIPFSMVAYCLMNNHYHLLLRSPKEPLSTLMMHVNRRYSDYFKKKYGYTGYLYEKRYYAEAAVTPEALLLISRYIHRNPLETKVPIVERMEHYPYSSYATYYYERTPTYPFLDMTTLLDMLPIGVEKTFVAYCRYCEQVEEE